MNKSIVYNDKYRIVDIIKDHIEEIKQLNCRDVVLEEINKVINCGDINFGFQQYVCPSCNNEHIVAFTCKSSFCPSCGVKYSIDRAEAINIKLDILPKNTSFRHFIFTIPEYLQYWARKHRDEFICIMFKVSNKIIQDIFDEKEIYSGVISAVHTFGREANYNVHIHMIVPEGGFDKEGNFIKLTYFNYDTLRKTWMYNLLNTLKELLPKGIIKQCWKDYKITGFYVNGKTKIKNKYAVVNYIVRYISRPVIAESRIVHYDGKMVTFSYVDHRDDKEHIITLVAIEFIKRLIIHIKNRNFKSLRYYGIFNKSSSMFKKVTGNIEDDKVKEIVTKVIKVCSKWANNIRKFFNYDPIICTKCGIKMILIDISYKGKFIEFEKVKRKHERRIHDEKYYYV